MISFCKYSTFCLIRNSFVFLCLFWSSAYAGTCIQDYYQDPNFGDKNQNLTCTANDVRIANASNIRDLNGNALNQCVEGQTFSFIADFTVLLTAKERFDIGLYFASDGDPNADGAISGTCSANIIRPFDNNTGLGSLNFIQLDNPQNDMCGDINDPNNPQVVTVQVNDVLCQDTDGDQRLNLPNCTSWRQPGSNEACLQVGDAHPGSPSKCNCDPDFNIDIFIEPGMISATKVANPLSLPEPGGDFTFTVNVTNDSNFTGVIIDRICDNRHGLIAKTAGAESCPAGDLSSVDPSNTDCDEKLPASLQPGETLSCDFTVSIHSTTAIDNITDTVTITGVDTSSNENPVHATASASVAITNVPPSAMVTKSFEGLQCVEANYGVKVTSTNSVETLDLVILTDSAFGDITQVQGNVLSTNCSVPATIAPNGHYSCSFTGKFCGNTHTNSVTATLKDDEGTSVSESATLTVTVSGQGN